MPDIITQCPWCSARGTAPTPLTDPEGAVPDEGDLGICTTCGCWTCFDPELPGKLRKPTRTEAYYIDRDPRCQLIAELWKKHYRGDA